MILYMSLHPWSRAIISLAQINALVAVNNPISRCDAVLRTEGVILLYGIKTLVRNLLIIKQSLYLISYKSRRIRELFSTISTLDWREISPGSTRAVTFAMRDRFRNTDDICVGSKHTLTEIDPGYTAVSRVYRRLVTPACMEEHIHIQDWKRYNGFLTLYTFYENFITKTDDKRSLTLLF